jgi:hypothetical protein
LLLKFTSRPSASTPPTLVRISPALGIADSRTRVTKNQSPVGFLVAAMHGEGRLSPSRLENA